MNNIFLKPRAKINVCLDVTGKRSDGYHDLVMIMQSLRLHDSMFMKKTDTGKVKINTNLRYLPVGDKNLVYRVCRYLLDRFGIASGIYIDLTKNIPVSAGLGGGSSDAASALLGMRKLFELPVSDGELFDIGKNFGADIPFFLYQELYRKQTLIARGIGEKLSPITTHPKTIVLLCKPNINVSTADVFSSLDIDSIQKRPDMDALIDAFNNKDLHKISQNACNVLETVTESKYSVISDIKKIMNNNNALVSMMSGSGPTVFGYYTRKAHAISASREISRTLGRMQALILTDCGYGGSYGY